MMEHGQQLTVFVNGVLRNNKSEILLLRRSFGSNLLPGYYELPGGKLQPGENLEVTLKRKFLQEVGVRVDIKNFIGSRADSNRHGAYLRVFFDVVVSEDIGGIVVPKLDNSHEEHLWHNEDIRSKLKIAPDTAHMLNIEADQLANQKAQVAPIDSNIHNTIILYTDGGSRGNPGPSAAGYIIMDDKERVLERGGEYLGVATNDRAEYMGILLGLRAVTKYRPSNIKVRMDSTLVINQMKGIYRTKDKQLWPIYKEAIGLVNHYRRVDFQHVDREYNRLADAQVNKILDDHEV